jgi:hypothetical protein
MWRDLGVFVAAVAVAPVCVMASEDDEPASNGTAELLAVAIPAVVVAVSSIQLYISGLPFPLCEFNFDLDLPMLATTPRPLCLRHSRCTRGTTTTPSDSR